MKVRTPNNVPFLKAKSKPAASGFPRKQKNSKPKPKLLESIKEKLKVGDKRPVVVDGMNVLH